MKHTRTTTDRCCPVLQDETERAYYATLLTREASADQFDRDRASDDAREFVENTNYQVVPRVDPGR